MALLNQRQPLPLITGKLKSTNWALLLWKAKELVAFFTAGLIAALFRLGVRDSLILRMSDHGKVLLLLPARSAVPWCCKNLVFNQLTGAPGCGKLCWLNAWFTLTVAL